MAISITIDNLDDGTFDRLTSEAQRLGKPPAAVAGDLLRDALARNAPAPTPASPVVVAAARLTPAELEERKAVLERLAGTWTEAEAREFEEATAPMRTIDPELWR